jgi:16S rRNA (adenine(1408)-N(1))-methyltransferase
VHVDLGTGDGAYAYRLARRDPALLVIGIDANAASLRDVSRRAAAKPARGGLPNALFGRLALEELPGELTGIADAVTVLLPWGSLLRAVALPHPAALARVRALCRPGAALRIVLGYHERAEGGVVRAAGLRPIEDPTLALDLAAGYLAAGFAVAIRPLPSAEVRALPTTWAKKLAFSGRQRLFLEIAGRAR